MLVFAYFKFLCAYAVAGIAGMLLSAAIAALQKSRTLATRLAGGILGSYPGVILFQALSLPTMAILFAIFWCILHVFGPFDGQAQIVWNLTVIALLVGVFVMASITGFVAGWGIGSKIAVGVPIRHALDASRPIRWAAARNLTLDAFLTSPVIKIVPVRTRSDIDAAKQLFTEYAASIGVDLGFQGFAAELAALPGDYSQPSGEILLAKLRGEIVGCVALRPWESGSVEMKRLYVRPAARGHGLGKTLVKAAIAFGRQRDYLELRLDTLTSMTSAQALYESLGFVEIPPYGNAHLPGTRFYAIHLTAEHKNPGSGYIPAQ